MAGIATNIQNPSRPDFVQRDLNKLLLQSKVVRRIAMLARIPRPMRSAVSPRSETIEAPAEPPIQDPEDVFRLLGASHPPRLVQVEPLFSTRQPSGQSNQTQDKEAKAAAASCTTDRIHPAQPPQQPC